MVSDVLFHAETAITRYLNAPTYRNVYSPEIRKRLLELIAKMKDIREELDSLPARTPS